MILGCLPHRRPGHGQRCPAVGLCAGQDAHDDADQAQRGPTDRLQDPGVREAPERVWARSASDGSRRNKIQISQTPGKWIAPVGAVPAPIGLLGRCSSAPDGFGARVREDGDGTGGGRGLVGRGRWGHRRRRGRGQLHSQDRREDRSEHPNKVLRLVPLRLPRTTCRGLLHDRRRVGEPQQPGCGGLRPVYFPRPVGPPGRVGGTAQVPVAAGSASVDSRDVPGGIAVATGPDDPAS